MRSVGYPGRGAGSWQPKWAAKLGPWFRPAARAGHTKKQDGVPRQNHMSRTDQHSTGQQDGHPQVLGCLLSPRDTLFLVAGRRGISLSTAQSSHDPTVTATSIARHTTRTRCTMMWGPESPYSPCDDVPYQTWQHLDDGEATIASPLPHFCSFPNPCRPQKEERVSVAAVTGTPVPMSVCFARSS